MSGALTLLFALLLARSIPRMPACVGCGVLLRPGFASAQESARLRVLMVLGTCLMAVSTMFRTGLTFPLPSALGSR